MTQYFLTSHGFRLLQKRLFAKRETDGEYFDLLFQRIRPNLDAAGAAAITGAPDNATAVAKPLLSSSSHCPICPVVSDIVTGSPVWSWCVGLHPGISYQSITDLCFDVLHELSLKRYAIKFAVRVNNNPAA
jgi:hypothetical protein